MTPPERGKRRDWRFGRDEDGDRWLGPLMWSPARRQDNPGDRSTTTMLSLWFVGRWHMIVEFTRSWPDA